VKSDPLHLRQIARGSVDSVGLHVFGVAFDGLDARLDEARDLRVGARAAVGAQFGQRRTECGLIWIFYTLNIAQVEIKSRCPTRTFPNSFFD